MRRVAVPVLLVVLAIACSSPLASPRATSTPASSSPLASVGSSPSPPVSTAAPSSPAAEPVATAVAQPTIDTTATPAEPFLLTSSAFADGAPIPTEHTCDSADTQLPVSWTGVPAGAVELALVMHDPDAGGFVHWVVVGISPDATALTDPLPDGARHGTNDFGRTRYMGPCPPSGNHTYVTTLFALSQALDLGEEPTAREVRQAAEGVTLATAQLRGTYRRR